MCGLSSCGYWDLGDRLTGHGVWGLSEPELEPMSPALAGEFFTTEPPGKPLKSNFIPSYQLNYKPAKYSLLNILHPLLPKPGTLSCQGLISYIRVCGCHVSESQRVVVYIFQN